MSSASNSTTSLVSSTTVSSRAPLNGSTAVQPKDFQSAFATLQSTYGFIGTAPSPVPKKSSPRSSTTSVTSSAVDAPRAPKATTKFESAFADLQSTYGFSWAVPSLLSQKREGGSFFSKFRSSSSPSSLSTPKTKTKTNICAVPRPTQQMIAL
ncbi:hypothetical protein B0H19DRAFT_1180961 [Mycena capillaripes]|nr:hypothetical protein B0H19DRAFT_1180961 [Mycena capillaripes]